MTNLQAFLLGLLQGLTEFLPISSSGHLVFGNYFFGIQENDIAFEVSVHVGTLIAVLIYFRKDITSLIVDFIKGGAYRKVALMLLLALVPTMAIGFGFKDFFETVFHAPRYAAVGLLLTSLFLFIAERVKPGSRELTKTRWTNALIVGFFQGLAIMPGISRSGSTIAAGLFSGLDRNAAARFSFLLAIPTILGAAILSAKDFTSIDSTRILPLLIGTVTSIVSGYAAIGILMAILKKGKLYVFSIYTALAGILGVIFLPG